MTQLAVPEREELALADSLQPFARLDPYADDGLAVQSGRVGPLGTISLGYRAGEDGRGLPKASRVEDERWLHLHDPEGRCPGLAEALEAGKWRTLRIAFPSNRGFIQQAFTRWSASALEVYGDATGLRVIRGGEHVDVPAGTAEFKSLLRTCKAETRLYFALARWLPSLDEHGSPQSEVYFPDGFGYYAFRTTGRHSAAEIMGYLESIGGFTGGRVAGIPFDLDVVFRQAAGKDGKKQTIPVANLVTRPPEHIKLNSRTFRQLAVAGLEQGQNLMLALPSAEDIAQEGPIVIEDISDDDAERLGNGDFPCDYTTIVRTWHAIVKGTPLSDDTRRAQWLSEWSAAYFGAEDTFDSLTAVKSLTHRDATQMLADLAEGLAEVREPYPEPSKSSRYDEIFGNEQTGTAYDTPKSADTMPATNPVTSADDKLWVRWTALADKARALGVKVPDVKLGVDREELKATGTQLLDNVTAREQQLAAEDVARASAEVDRLL